MHCRPQYPRNGYRGVSRTCETATGEIVEQLPSITLADVYAAIAYYREEIEADFEDARRWAEYGKTQRSKVKEKLEQNPGLREKILGENPSG